VKIAISVICGLIVGLCSPAFTAGASAPSCAPSGAKVKKTTSDVQIYRDPAQDNALFVCNRRDSKSYLLDNPPADMHAFPTVAVRGNFVAWAFNAPSEIELGGEFATTLAVVDRRKFGAEDPAGALIRNVGGNPDSDEFVAVAVARVVVSSRGDIAWTECPATNPSSPAESLKDNCRRAGALDKVWKLTASGRPRRLDKGRRIDPTSLRLTGNSLSWTNSGRRHRAALR
jgi:hypothetical protein